MTLLCTVTISFKGPLFLLCTDMTRSTRLNSHFNHKDTGGLKSTDFVENNKKVRLRDQGQ